LSPFQGYDTYEGIQTAGIVVRAEAKNKPALAFRSCCACLSTTFHRKASLGLVKECLKCLRISSVEMNKGYTHMELEPLRAAISAIPA